MKPNMEEHGINLFGEFREVQLEREYLDHEFNRSFHFIRPIALLLGIMNSLFIIPDYFFLQNKDQLPWILLIRILFLLAIAFFCPLVKRLKSSLAIINIISFIEASFIITFLYVMYQYEHPDFLIQCLGLITFILAVFMVPNRWINMNLIFLSAYFSFIMMSIYHIPEIQIAHLSAGLVYLFIVLALSSITAYRNHYYKRIQYVLHNELLTVATRDHLTQVYNRVKLDEEMAHHLQGSKKKKKPLSLIMFDFDDFKRINDHYGHVYGDYIIVEAIHLIRDNIRDSDILARWGGDEFILLLPDTNEEQALELAWRLSEEIEDHRFDQQVSITCSFGVAEMLPDDDIHRFLSRVDQMLYLSKKTGKNMVNGRERGVQGSI